MDKTLFDDLVGSLKEAKAIAAGKAKASRRFELMPPMSRRYERKLGCRKANLRG